MPRAITLRSDFAASDLRSLGLEGRAMVSAGSSCHGISCSRHHAAVRQKIRLHQVFRFAGPVLINGRRYNAMHAPMWILRLFYGVCCPA
jgi:hypothetical protein